MLNNIDNIRDLQDEYRRRREDDPAGAYARLLDEVDHLVDAMNAYAENFRRLGGEFQDFRTDWPLEERLRVAANYREWIDSRAISRKIHEHLEALERMEHVKVSPGDVILLYTGRWKRRAALGPWPNTTGFAGYHADVAYFLKERGVSFIGSDGPNDVSPSGLPQSIAIPLHQLALVAMGVSIFDNLDFERAAAEARRLNRYEFLFMAARLRIEMGTGSPLNPLAIF